MLRLLVVSLFGIALVSSSVVVTSKGELLGRGREQATVNEAIFQQVNGSTPTGWVQIGSPPKWLYVIFDTGSDKLVAKTWDTVSNELQSIDQGEDGMVVPSFKLYDHSNSSTYHRRFMKNPDTHRLEPDRNVISYGSGSAIVDVGSDTILVGKRSIDNFTLMEITQDSLDLLHTSKGIAGILGLQHMKNKSLGRSLFSRLREDGKMTAFGYCRGTGNNGTFIWGDNSTEGKAIDVVGEMHWAVHLGSVSLSHNDGKSALLSMNSDYKGKSSHRKSHSPEFDSQDTAVEIDDDTHGDVEAADGILADHCANHSCCGILDTGSNIIAGPKEVMEAIARKVNVKQDCSNFDKLPAISLVFGGIPVDIQPRGYVMKIPAPEGGFGDDTENAVAEKGTGDSSGDSAASLGTIKAHGEVAEAGLAQKQVSTLSSGARRWRAAFERLYKDNGVDLRDMVEDMLMNFNETGAPEFMCMPALVPLDKKTEYGPLWIVGTPLLETYYARWSFAKDAESPQIHLKPVKETDVCKAQGDAASPNSDSSSSVLIRKERITRDAVPQAASGIIERKIEDIAFPNWAKSLVRV